MTERRTGGSSQTTGDAETGRQREGGRGRGSRRRRERVAAARALPADTLLRPRESAGGTEWQNERDAGAEDRRRVPASLVGPRVTEGPPRGAARRADRETAGSPRRAAGLRDRRPDRQTCPGTDWQPGGGSSLPLRSQGPRRRRQRPPSASEQRGAAGTSGSPAEAAAVAAALGATALPLAPPTPQKAPFISS